MVKKTITERAFAERLGRFEALSGLKYSEKAADIWWDHCKSYKENEFCQICRFIEKSVKWHILPTLNDFYKEKNDRYIY